MPPRVSSRTTTKGRAMSEALPCRAARCTLCTAHRNSSFWWGEGAPFPSSPCRRSWEVMDSLSLGSRWNRNAANFHGPPDAPHGPHMKQFFLLLTLRLGCRSSWFGHRQISSPPARPGGGPRTVPPICIQSSFIGRAGVGHPALSLAVRSCLCTDCPRPRRSLARKFAGPGVLRQKRIQIRPPDPNARTD